MKVNKKYSTLLSAIIMGLLMSLSMSFFLTLINLGLSPAFLERWMCGFAIGFVVTFPVSLFAIPAVRKIVEKLTSG